MNTTRSHGRLTACFWDENLHQLQQLEPHMSMQLPYLAIPFWIILSIARTMWTSNALGNEGVCCCAGVWHSRFRLTLNPLLPEGPLALLTAFPLLCYLNSPFIETTGFSDLWTGWHNLKQRNLPEIYPVKRKSVLFPPLPSSSPPAFKEKERHLRSPKITCRIGWGLICILSFSTLVWL